MLVFCGVLFCFIFFMLCLFLVFSFWLFWLFLFLKTKLFGMGLSSDYLVFNFFFFRLTIVFKRMNYSVLKLV